jgi:glycosyltransferase involved in cell wall biosynthesis
MRREWFGWLARHLPQERRHHAALAAGDERPTALGDEPTDAFGAMRDRFINRITGADDSNEPKCHRDHAINDASWLRVRDTELSATCLVVPGLHDAIHSSAMRIMHISTRLILGGSQENTVLSCEGQADHGHTVSLVFGPIYGPEGSLLDRVTAHGGIDTIETPNMVRELRPLRDWRCYGDLRKLIREWKPDVVHTHSSKAGIIGRFAAGKERVPCVIHTVHGPPFHAYETWWRNRLYVMSERAAAKRCHKIACVAEAMRDQFLQEGIGKPEQYEIVYSGMEIEPFLNPNVSREAMRDQLGFTEDDFVLGTIARLAELKGHDDLLDALRPVFHVRPNLKLLWVGDGWWRERLLKRIHEMKLDDRIVTVGLVPPEDIPKFLQAMDVLAHPSYREGLPRTVTQALLSATPAIAYDVDGTREVCIDNMTGKLLGAGDIEGLRAAVLWMMDKPEERKAMGERGREMCRERFAAATMVDRLEEVYSSVLDRVVSVRSD